MGDLTLCACCVPEDMTFSVRLEIIGPVELAS